ncbi:MAG: cellulose synthase operon protein YhjQ/BcsQ, partial [Planctomycetota bacterium]
QSVNPVRFVSRNLRGRLRMAAGLALGLAVIGGLAGIFAKGPEYVSHGIIQVSANKPSLLYDDQDDTRLRLFDAFVSSEMSYLKSPPVLQRAVSSKALQDIQWGESPEAVARLGQSIEIKREGGLILVSAKHARPDESATLVNAVLDSFLELHTEQVRRQDSVRERELSNREGEIVEKLRQLDKELLEVGQEHGVASLTSAHVRKIGQIEDADIRIDELQETIAAREADGGASEIDIGEAEIKRLTVLDHAMADMLFERAIRASELEIVASKYGKQHYRVRDAQSRVDVIDDAIEERRQQLSTLGTTGALTRNGDVQKEESLLDLKALLERLSRRCESLRAEARDLNRRIVQLDFLEKEREEYRMVLEETRRGLEEVRVESRNTLPGTLAIKSRGVAPTAPADDKRTAFAGAGAGAGLLGGFGLTLLLGLGLKRYRYSDDLEDSSTTPPLLGVVPESDDEVMENDAGWQRAIHQMRVDMQVADAGRPGGQIVAVMGAGADHGASSIAMGLARSFASTGMRTALVDADLVDCGITYHLGLTRSRGFREAIVDGKLDPLQLGDARDSLEVLPSGTVLSVMDDRVARSPLERILRRMRERYDLVIIDVGSFSDRFVARLVAAIADQVLYVVNANTPASNVDADFSNLERIAPHRIRTVLNRALSDDPRLAFQQPFQNSKETH